MINFLKKYLSIYDSKETGLKQRAVLLCLTSLVALMMIVFIGIITLVLNRSHSMIIFLSIGFILIVAVQVLLFCGHYELSACILVTVGLCIESFYIFSDFYENAFDIYRYTFSTTIILVIGGIFFTKKSSLIYISSLCLFGIIFFYYLRNCIQLKNGSDPLTVVSTIVCIGLFVFFSIISVFSLIISSTLLKTAEAQRKLAEKERDKYSNSFNILSMYTKPSLPDSLRNGQDPTKITPTKEKRTILFCDICNFVQMSESLTPIEITDFLNEYFTKLLNIIVENHGEIDKLVGDELLAVFYNPHDAIRAAFDIREAIRSMTINNQPIENGIGISEGDVIIGNIGSRIKMDYTVIGKTVNIASRLQGLTRVYNERIIVSKEVYNVMEPEIQQKFTCINQVKIRGVDNPMDLFGYK